jgi:hypothetical protein
MFEPLPVYTHEWSPVSAAKLKNAAFAEPAAKARAAQASKDLFIRISLLVAELEQLRNHGIAGRPSVVDALRWNPDRTLG